MKHYEKLAEEYVRAKVFYEGDADFRGKVSLFIAGYLAAREGAAVTALRYETGDDGDSTARCVAADIRQMGEEG